MSSLTDSGMPNWGSIDRVYKTLVMEVLVRGTTRETRNGTALSTFGTHLDFDIENIGLPLISWRKMYTKGIVGEFLGFLQDATTVEEFEALGCPYWKLWADEEGSLVLDYPPREQLDALIEGIKQDPTGRRHIINLWDHTHLHMLSLPCCHFNYQFYVRKGTHLDMIWTQRSVDVAVGLPSDFVLAFLYVIHIAGETGLKPGRVTMNFGDTHIYSEHVQALKEMVMLNQPQDKGLAYKWDGKKLSFEGYTPNKPVKFLLKG
jgi:thymidylate synthase